MKKIITLLLLFFTIGFPQEKELLKGEMPPEFSYYSLSEGETVSYKADEYNGKVILIDFWATWCAPCIESIPHLNSLVQKFKDRNVKFISITYEPGKLVKKFLGDHPMKSDVGLDEDFKIFRSYNAWAIPNIVMLNSNGKLAGRVHPNYLTEDVINTLITGGIPDVKNTPENLFDPIQAEEHFRSFLKKQKE